MNLSETIRTSIVALRGNKIRTFLTMLGIIIGVFSIVLLVSLVRGVQNYIEDQFNSIGSNLLFVTPGRGGLNRDPATMFSDNKLNISQVNTLKNEAPYILALTPMTATGITTKYKNKNFFGLISGAFPEYSQIFNIEYQYGDFYKQSDEDNFNKVAVIGSNVYSNLFNNSNPIGEYIKIGKYNFQVVGVLKSKGQDFDDQIVIPFNTSKKFLELDKIANILVKLKEGEDIDIDSKKIEGLLLRELKRDDFSVMNQKDVLSSIQSILQILSFGLGAVAAISLLVGGIGIMNIMLVSVTERIKEIGLRKALGATSINIAFQFLFEAIFLSVSGGLIGLVFGYGASIIARHWLRTEVPIWTIAVSLSFSIVVGVLFGTYPAIKASKKDPIEALRYE